MPRVQSLVKHITSLTKREPKQWLVLGKGPTAAHYAKLKLERYHIITLNHACQIVEPAIAHFVDIEACYSCSQTLLGYLTNGTKTMLALPWCPHYECKARDYTLQSGPRTSEVATLFQTVGHYCAQERLLSYNATTSKKRQPFLNLLRLRYFSATAAFSALTAAGIKRILSLGVDGGTGYAPMFDEVDRLKNGRESFDIQTKELKAIVREHKATWQPLV